MYIARSTLRVRYAETDQMSVVYYGVYPQYFEVGRVEALRQLQMSYREMEEAGIMLPVLNLEINYRRPARYDDELTVVTMIRELPGTRIKFYHEIRNPEDELLTTGSVELVFVDKESRRPRKAPEELLKRLQPLITT
jgi:acyl-CoA thioester hydrolase